jgi:hypothetical protein
MKHFRIYITKVSLLLVTGFALASMGASCNSQGSKQTNRKKSDNAKPELQTPVFNADSAYYYVQKQVDFGHRIPNTDAHEACAQWLTEKMDSIGAEVIVQQGDVTAFDNSILHIKNIIAQFQPEKNDRILLFAHWDSRPFSDNDPDPSNHNKPIDGASDGASGIGVLIEIARHLKDNPTASGIDIIFFDAEDYGTPQHLKLPYKEDTWCLGSQYWGKNLHKKKYYARYGILLDMVGAKGARFYQEKSSLQIAPKLVNHIWNTASNIGYGNFFVFDKGGYITDDHIYVNNHTGIPVVDIIQYDPSSRTSFGSYWHTQNDTMENIDRATLKAVGQTLMDVIYRNDF